jgi:hypothetical protein
MLQSGQPVRKSAIFYYDGINPQVIENKNCEAADSLNAAVSSSMTSLWVRVGCARKVGWGRNESVTLLCLVPYTSALMYSMQTQGSETFLTIATDHNLHCCCR